MNVAGSLVRRGLDAHAEHGDKINIPTWGAVMLVSTTIVYLVAMFTIEYTFGRLIPTLVMIESPQDSISFEPLATEDPDSTINKDPEQPPKPQLITSSFRRTLRHLGGFSARFRGFGIFIVNALAVQWIAGVLSVIPIINLLPRGFSNAVALVLCAQLSLTWTHIVISQPSPRTWFRRLAPVKMWKKVAIPTAVFALAEQLAVYIPIYMSILAGLVDKDAKQIVDLTPNQKTAMTFKAIGILIFGLVFAFLIVIPANVTLTRVQASLLEDTEETIVPFDRSFGGKVIPEIVGGSGMIGMLDAWKTFDWASRIRLIKTYLKVVGMQMAVTFLFTMCLISQLFIIAGNDWSKLVPEDGKKN
ncbi:hypothetical protein DL95DRAFT_388792 [Leptodontidium sp. 2 PMI_412]|nr:hypothetical protein BKA61DRAFT_733530 [Leptodontidium sp. MPI-SDFR-AT-0119]KAH9215273.1 hypothetical protein DL95DRAFT_388792 [Leptodontidium sp. 2 PMI_412]